MADTTDLEFRLAEAESGIAYLRQQLQIHATNTENVMQMNKDTRTTVGSVTDRVSAVEGRVGKLEGAGSTAAKTS